MSATTAERLLRRPLPSPSAASPLVRVTPEEAGWTHLGFEVRRLAPGASHEGDTGEHEAAFVLLGGRCSVRTSRGDFEGLGHRADVFSGMPYALYLPRRTRFEVRAAETGVELAHAWTATDRDHAPRLVTPEDCTSEIRGGRHNTRQVVGVLPPGFPCHKLVCVEVYTPGGNWSSYPPHKHDQHRTNADGCVIEAALEEIYYYRIRQPNGFAVQRIYSRPGEDPPGEEPLDAVMVARDGDLVLVPRGYHPVSAAYGYDCYYLNFLAGSAQTLANSEDPDHVWVKASWTSTDPRVPVVAARGPASRER